jgi:hypothetical protein
LVDKVGFNRLFIPINPPSYTHHHYHQSSTSMPQVRTTLADITTPPANRIDSTYIVPWAPVDHAVETTAYAFSRYNHHLFCHHRDNRLEPYPSVDDIYRRSNTPRPGDEDFQDVFLDDM